MRRLLRLVPPLSSTRGSATTASFSSGSNTPAIGSNARSTTRSPSSSPSSPPSTKRRAWSPRVLKILALIFAVEQSDPSALEPLEAVATNLLRIATARRTPGRHAAPLALPPVFPIKMALSFREVPPDPKPDPKCELCRAASWLEPGAGKRRRRSGTP